MLQRLSIKNIALIDSVQINFTDGLNVLSGETGAGKSVIIESLNFVLGAKADKSLIRSGQNECVVVAEFDVSNNAQIFDIYEQFDFEKEELLIISRKFNIDGKSSIKINGNSATVSMLKSFTSILVDVHGQSEHFNLLKPSNQLALIDKFGGQDISIIKNKLKTVYSEYKTILSNLNDFGGDESQRAIRLDILNYQINEITNANLQDNEEENLISIKQKIANQEKIVNSFQLLNSSISSEGGIEDILGNAKKNFSAISDFDDEYMQIYQRLESVFAEISDISNTSNAILDNFDQDEYNIYEIENRLDLIKNLKNKYGKSIEEINIFLQHAIIEKEKIENYTEIIKQLEDKKIKLQQEIYELYLSLSQKRKYYSQLLKENILSELVELGMKKANFEIAFNRVPQFNECNFSSENGFDEIEFLFSANLGEPLKNLSMVISGGEMSRFMLAIKAQTAKYNEVSTFIFDEIDSGISGNIAKIVAEKFAKISKSKQIIAITHLPQISAMGDNNLLIEKIEADTNTMTKVKALSTKEKILEIVRLVGGDINSQTAITHSKDLIQNATDFKNNL